MHKHISISKMFQALTQALQFIAYLMLVIYLYLGVLSVSAFDMKDSIKITNRVGHLDLFDH